MIYDEHIKNANRSKLRKNRSADLLFSRKVQRLKSFAEIPDFQGSRPRRAGVAQPAWRWEPVGILPADYVGSSTARFTSCFSYIYSANRRV